MVEHSQPNTHKSFHVGHLRNITLGHTIFNILRCAGFEAVGATYIGDIGMHVVKCLWCYERFHTGEEPDSPEARGRWLGEIYGAPDEGGWDDCPPELLVPTRIQIDRSITGTIVIQRDEVDAAPHDVEAGGPDHLPYVDVRDDRVDAEGVHVRRWVFGLEVEPPDTPDPEPTGGDGEEPEPSSNLQELIDTMCVVGVTTNPTIFAAAIHGSESYDHQLHALAIREVSVEEALRTVTATDVRDACDVLVHVVRLRPRERRDETDLERHGRRV